MPSVIQSARILITALATVGFALAQSPGPLQQEIDQLRQRLDQLEQQQKIDERKKEIQDQEAAANAKNGAIVTADTGGFNIRSNDGNFRMKIGVDLQVDNRSFQGIGSQGLADTILLRRMRPTFSGSVYKYVDYYFRPDFGQGSTVIYDAYLELKYFDRFRVRVGKFKPPVGLERLQSDDDTNFIERGSPTLLVPSRDIGYQISGDIVKNRVNYSVGVFNGVPDNGLTDAAASNHRDYAARLFLTPFQPNEKSVLSGLGVGIGSSSGSVDGETLPAYKTFGQASFFTFASGVTEAGHRTRLSPQLYYYLGPFGLLSEYGLTEEGLQKGAFRTDVAFRAWQVQTTFLLTGEKKAFTTVTPRKSFDPKNHGWGAVELAARVGDFSAGKGIYDFGFASPTTTARRFHEWVGGVNWYLNRMVRVTADYGHTNFWGGAAAALGGNRAPEKVILFRFQINFI